MIREWGDGEKVACVWCDAMLDVFTVQADRLDPDGTYRWDNIVPACGPCNRSRTPLRPPMSEHCRYG